MMTKKEIIAVLNDIKDWKMPSYNQRQKEAITIAVNTLESTDDDTVSRQDVKNMLCYELCTSFNNCLGKGCYKTSIADGLPSMPAKQPWHLCSEKLPTVSGRYMITSCTDGVNTAFYNIAHKKWVGYNNSSVIAWGPLPKAYTGEKE